MGEGGGRTRSSSWRRACSTTPSWPLMTMHIRLRSRISVRHTTSESMLNPRPARIPETRDNTPGSFCTRQFSTCLDWERIFCLVSPKAPSESAKSEGRKKRKKKGGGLTFCMVVGSVEVCYTGCSSPPLLLIATLAGPSWGAEEARLCAMSCNRARRSSRRWGVEALAAHRIDGAPWWKCHGWQIEPLTPRGLEQGAYWTASTAFRRTNNAFDSTHAKSVVGTRIINRQPPLLGVLNSTTVYVLYMMEKTLNGPTQYHI